MSSKRKIGDGIIPTKKAASKISLDGPPPKKQRKEEGQEDGKTVKNSKTGTSDAITPQPVSLIQEEERSFPRGGGGVLTAVEHKQIQIQATRDALFEESGQKRPREGSDVDEDAGENENAPPVKTVKKRSKKPKTKPDAPEDAELRIRTDALKFKRLAPGSQMLGRVSKILTNELVLDLPNNLTGHVSIANISPILTDRLMAFREDDEEDDDKDDTEADIDLESLFYLGQYLRASVISTTGDLSHQSTKSKKRIELSIDPRQTNPKFNSTNTNTNCTLNASVASVEDHGLIMNMGFEDTSVKGFMSKKEIPSNLGISKIQVGAVFTCHVTGLSSNGKVIKLSASPDTAGNLKRGNILTDPLTIDLLLPGTAVELLVSQVSGSTVAGHLMGTVDAGTDIVHCGAASRRDNIGLKYKTGQKVQARILFKLVDSEKPVFGLTLLEHLLSLTSKTLRNGKEKINPLTKYPIGSIVEKAKVINVESGLGVFVDIGMKDMPAFVHVSKMSDERIEPPSQTTGPYRSGTSHRARIIGYNTVDGVYLASFEKSVLEQEYLRIEDVPVGQVVKGTVEKLISQKSGSSGVIVNIAKGISGLVPELHLADIHLQHPERKFKDGLAVTARVLSIDPERHQIRLTLKKSLVNTDAEIWTSYDKVAKGTESPGTVLTLDSKGALMQFFGNVRGFLPVSEMSDTFVEDPKMRFRIGQVLNVRPLSIDPTNQRMTLSCKSPESVNGISSAAEIDFKLGQLVSGTVLEKSHDTVTIKLIDSTSKASIPIVHLSDGSTKKIESAAKQIRVGQTLHDLVVFEIFPKRQAVYVSNKPSLVKAAKNGEFRDALENLEEGMTIDGIVRNVIEDGIFLQTLGGLTGLIHRTQITPDKLQLPDYGVAKGHSLSARILSIDVQQQRFSLTLKPVEDTKQKQTTEKPSISTPHAVANPIDGTSTTIDDYAIGNMTTAKITSVKDSQLNVQLADNVQGRIDVSEAYSKWEDIRDRKHPLRFFKAHDKMPVRILGIHDARNHRFLPISHRGGKVPVFELSAKSDAGDSLLSYDQLKVNSWHPAFVNNITESALWVNISPNVRGRIERMDVSEDVSVVSDLASSFPVGSAIRVRVKSVDVANGRLDLSAKASSSEQALTLDSLSEGMIVTGRVTKVTERALLLQLGPNLVGQVGLSELSDNFDEANPGKHQKNDVVRACVLSIDRSNKRLHLTTRASMVLSSSMTGKDRYVSSVDQLSVEDIVRGFIKNVTDAGLFVALSHSVTAFVPVSDLSDFYLKDWKASFEVDRLVRGKIISVDNTSNHVKLSLKGSIITGNYVAKLGFNDFHKDQIVTGTVRKVEPFGAFIVLDNTNNVSGLAHRSQVAERRVENVVGLYKEGDKVKAKILKIEPGKRHMSLGLKRSYFETVSDDDDDSEDDEEEEGGAALELENGDDSEDQKEEMDDVSDEEGGVDLDLPEGDDASNTDSADEASDADPPSDSGGLQAGPISWSGTLPTNTTSTTTTTSLSTQPTATTKSSRQKQSQTYQPDLTATLSTTTSTAQTPTDYERHLLTFPNSSTLWTSYISHHLALSALTPARETAERALNTIHIREQDEKLAVWLAYIGLEIEYGDSESFDGIFARACEMSDSRVIHERTGDALAASGRIERAGEVFEKLVKNKSWNADVEVWLKYARFLFDGAGDPEKARQLMARADQVLSAGLAGRGGARGGGNNKAGGGGGGSGSRGSDGQEKEKIHRDLLIKWAMLEYKCHNGEPEKGRNMFEELVGLYPRRWDVWDLYVDMERRIERQESETRRHDSGERERLKRGKGKSAEDEALDEQRQRIRALYERMTDPKVHLKARRMKWVFKEWLKWEEDGSERGGGGEGRRVERVKGRAAEAAGRLRQGREEGIGGGE